MMACRTVALDGGGVMWLCGDALEGHPVCRVCNHMATKLCDYPVGNDKTCDSALCDHHSFSVVGDLDYCPEHAKEYKPYSYAEIFFIQGSEQGGSGI